MQTLKKQPYSPPKKVMQIPPVKERVCIEFLRMANNKKLS